MKKITLLTLLSCLAFMAKAQTPNWSDDIASIIYNNCSSCHRSGGLGPFPLMSYQDAVNNAAGILQAVNSRSMPPWKPDPNYRHLKNERNLSSAQISKIQQWVAASTPAGNLANAPQPPVFQPGSQMQNIDKTISTLNYTVSGNTDVYRTFVIHSGNTSDKYINEIEFVPGNNAVVHHIILFQDPTGYSDSIDKADPAPGFASNGTSQPSAAAKYICVWAPGAGNYKLPDNMGIRVEAAADYLVEIHYAPGSNGQSDQTQINLKYASGVNIRPVYVEPVMDWGPGSMINPTLYIPANTVKTYTQRFINNITDYSVLSVFPHMHKIGSSYKIFATNASGLDTVPFIYIPHWDFHWQGFYTFQKIQKFSLNQRLWGVGVYDNTANNPDNPNSPPKNVFWGEHTTDEMMITFLAYTPYQPGDENIVLDSAGIKAGVEPVAANAALHVYPNPASGQLNIYTELFAADAVLSISNVCGRQVMKQTLHQAQTTLPVEQLPAGVYFVQVSANNRTAVQKFIKQ